MKKFNKITPEGTKDILFEECLSQRTVSERLTHIFKCAAIMRSSRPAWNTTTCSMPQRRHSSV